MQTSLWMVHMHFANYSWHKYHFNNHPIGTMNDGLNQRGVLCRKSASAVKGFDTGLVGMFQNGNRMIQICDQNILTSNSSLPRALLSQNWYWCYVTACVVVIWWYQLILSPLPPYPPSWAGCKSPGPERAPKAWGDKDAVTDCVCQWTALLLKGGFHNSFPLS